jgi:hypothetical protein
MLSLTPSKCEGQRPRWEVADIFRDHLDQLGKISAEKWKVVNALISCRTARLGGHVYECDHCGHTLNAYNSCRNRHCPKCQAKARSKWLKERMEELLPVEYFHVVFTIPDLLNPLTLINKEVVYEIQFRAAKETLVQSSANPKNLGARIGFLAILHTWGQNLLDHPHIHCVVPGGGLSLDGSRWISCPKGFFVSVKILSKLFRGKFLDYLKNAFQDHRLRFFGNSRNLEKPKEFQKLLDQAYSKPWVWCMPNRPSPDPSRSYGTWATTPTGWRSPITESSMSRMASFASGTRATKTAIPGKPYPCVPRSSCAASCCM